MTHGNWLLLGLAVPFVLGALGALVPPRFGSRAWGTGWGWVLGVTLAMGLAYWARSGWPRVPPNQAHQWLVLVGLPGVALAAVMAGRVRLQPAMGWVTRGGVAVGLPTLLLQGPMWHRWSPEEAVGWVLGIGMITLVGWWGLHRVARGESGGGRAVPMVLAVTATGASAVAFFSYVVTQAMWSLSLAAALLGGALMVLALRLRHGLVAAVDVGLPLTMAMVLLGWLYGQAEGKLWAGALLALAPLMAAGAHLPGGRWLLGMAGWRMEMVRVAAAVGPTLAAVGLAGVQWLRAG